MMLLNESWLPVDGHTCFDCSPGHPRFRAGQQSKLSETSERKHEPGNGIEKIPVLRKPAVLLLVRAQTPVLCQPINNDGGDKMAAVLSFDVTCRSCVWFLGQDIESAAPWTQRWRRGQPVCSPALVDSPAVFHSNCNVVALSHEFSMDNKHLRACLWN